MLGEEGARPLPSILLDLARLGGELGSYAPEADLKASS